MNLPQWLITPFKSYLPFHLAPLAEALVWGQTNSLTDFQYQLFRQTGLLHLMVLSGQNITLLIGSLILLLKQAGPRAKLALTLLVATGYLIVFSQEAPIVRASIMAVLSVLAIEAQATTTSLYLLFVTSIIMLAVKPQWLNSLSFQLSVLSTLGIILFYQPIKQKLPRWSYISSNLALTLSAQSLTTILLLLVFRQYYPFSIILNIAVAWLIEPIMILGVGLSLVGQYPSPLAQLLTLPLWGLLQTLLTIVKFGYQLSTLMIIQI